MITVKLSLNKAKKAHLRKELREYMPLVCGLAEDEKKSLREWVMEGNSVYENPWYYSDDRGNPMDYVTAARAVASQLAGDFGPLQIYPDGGFELDRAEKPF